MPFHLFVNPASGRENEVGELVARCERELANVQTTVVRPEIELGGLVRQAVAAGRDIVAAGGDGTVSAVAQHLVGTDGTLGLLPSGTLNHFARDLGISDLEVAYDVLRAGRSRAVDVGRIGDDYFLNNVGLGVYPEIVRERERHEDRWGKWLATVKAAGQLMGRARPLLGSMSVDDDLRELRAWAVFVGNGRYSTDPGSIGERHRLDDGVLDVHLLRARLRATERVRVAGKVMRGKLWSSHAVVRTDALRVEIHLDGESRPISRDDETDPNVRDVAIGIAPLSLRVLTPPA